MDQLSYIGHPKSFEGTGFFEDYRRQAKFPGIYRREIILRHFIPQKEIQSLGFFMMHRKTGAPANRINKEGHDSDPMSDNMTRHTDPNRPACCRCDNSRNLGRHDREVPGTSVGYPGDDHGQNEVNEKKGPSMPQWQSDRHKADGLFPVKRLHRRILQKEITELIALHTHGIEVEAIEAAYVRQYNSLPDLRSCGFSSMEYLLKRLYPIILVKPRYQGGRKGFEYSNGNMPPHAGFEGFLTGNLQANENALRSGAEGISHQTRLFYSIKVARYNRWLLELPMEQTLGILVTQVVNKLQQKQRYLNPEAACVPGVPILSLPPEWDDRYGFIFGYNHFTHGNINRLLAVIRRTSDLIYTDEYETHVLVASAAQKFWAHNTSNAPNISKVSHPSNLPSASNLPNASEASPAYYGNTGSSVSWPWLNPSVTAQNQQRLSVASNTSRIFRPEEFCNNEKPICKVILDDSSAKMAHGSLPELEEHGAKPRRNPEMNEISSAESKQAASSENIAHMMSLANLRRDRIIQSESPISYSPGSGPPNLQYHLNNAGGALSETTASSPPKLEDHFEQKKSLIGGYSKDGIMHSEARINCCNSSDDSDFQVEAKEVASSDDEVDDGELSEIYAIRGRPEKEPKDSKLVASLMPVGGKLSEGVAIPITDVQRKLYRLICLACDEQGGRWEKGEDILELQQELNRFLILLLSKETWLLYTEVTGSSLFFPSSIAELLVQHPASAVITSTATASQWNSFGKETKKFKRSNGRQRKKAKERNLLNSSKQEKHTGINQDNEEEPLPSEVEDLLPSDGEDFLSSAQGGKISIVEISAASEQHQDHSVKKEGNISSSPIAGEDLSCEKTTGTCLKDTALSGACSETRGMEASETGEIRCPSTAMAHGEESAMYPNTQESTRQQVQENNIKDIINRLLVVEDCLKKHKGLSYLEMVPSWTMEEENSRFKSKNSSNIMRYSGDFLDTSYTDSLELGEIRKLMDANNMEEVLHRLRMWYRNLYIGTPMSAIKNEWTKLYSDSFPLLFYMSCYGVRKLKTLLQDIPDLILTGAGGYIRVSARTRAAGICVPLKPIGIGASGVSLVAPALTVAQQFINQEKDVV